MAITPVPYIRKVSPDISADFFGIRASFLAEGKDNEGRFALIEYDSQPGHEPPPHFHEEEDETFYILEGSFDAYFGDQVASVGPGECVYLPRKVPHAWIITSPRLRALIFVQPPRLDQIFREIAVLQQEIDKVGDSTSYSTALQTPVDIVGVAKRHGMYALAPEEIAEQMPRYPVRQQD